MSDNFLGLDNTALSKNSTDCLLNLLQLNLLGANSTTAAAAAAAVANSNVYQNIGKPTFYPGNQPSKTPITGRAITNTGNLANNPANSNGLNGGSGGIGGGGGGGNFGQPDIFSTAALSGNGVSGPDLNSEYKNNLRIGSADNSMGSKSFRNGDGELIYLDFDI